MRGSDVVAGAGAHLREPVRHVLTTEHYAEMLAHRRALDAVQALHTPAEWTVGMHDGQPIRQTLCSECRTSYPCSTVTAIEEALA